MDDRIAGIILAGGLSRRMGGGDKGLLALGGRPVLERAAIRLAPQVGPMALNANGDPARFGDLGLPVVADTVEGFAGPLAGILAGLEWAAANTRCRAIVTVAGDTPFFPGNLTERLASAVADRPGMIAMACSRARPHPTFALWPLAHRKRLATFLANEGNRRVLSFIERQGFRQVDFEDEAGACAPFDPFFNINTPADLAAAELILRGFEP